MKAYNETAAAEWNLWILGEFPANPSLPEPAELDLVGVGG
jgi:hypothetical protein